HRPDRPDLDRRITSDRITRWPSLTPPARTRPGRPPAFDKATYRKRNVVERCFNRLKQWRDLATRYAKRASLYRASLILIAAIIWLP
ncbi:transposase, partial [Micromonospora aurantiaca (nom. illeg.)]